MVEAGMSSANQADVLCRVRLAEQMERYEDAVNLLNDMIAQGIDLGQEGRNLLSVAYKSVLGARRYSWRVLAAYENKTDSGDAERKMAKDYREKVDAEYRDTCNTLIKMLDETLLPNTTELETKIYYLKMKADYYRYLAEITFDERRKIFADKSMEAYEEATEVAKNMIKASHPIRMGLALNYAVFYYEIKKDTKKACSIAKQAYVDARPELVEVGSEDTREKRESLLILQLLQDNVTKWKGVLNSEIISDEEQKENIEVDKEA